jgi:hypothetical protein
MPGIVIFVYLASTSLMDKRLQIGNWLKPALFTLLALVPLVIWLGFLFQRGGMQAVAEVLLTNSVGRFSGSFVEAGHYEPFYYYIAKLPEAFLPWNILVYLGLWHFRKSLVRNRYHLFFSVWLLAPIYFGLSLGLLALALKFFQEVIHLLPSVFSMAESELILVLLSLIDMALVGGLLVMVMISGYENFVSQLDIDDNKEKLNWQAPWTLRP